MPAVSDRDAKLDGLPVFWREAPVASGAPLATDAGDHGAAGAARGAGDTAHTDTPTPAPTGTTDTDDAPTPLYLHGVPTNSDDWLPFLAKTGGLAPDLPGFGRSGKPGNLKYTIAEYADFIERWLTLVGVERVSIVVHDWGAVGLAFAQAHPERVARLVVINAVPFLPGYRWHRAARAWRTPVLGELMMGATTRWALRRATRIARPRRAPMPAEWLDSVFDHFDQGTQRAILRLYRSSPADVLAAAGAGLGEVRGPALVLWGTADPYIPVRFARAYAEALPDAELVQLPDAGHWPWLDRPDVIDRVAAFLTEA